MKLGKLLLALGLVVAPISGVGFAQGVTCKDAKDCMEQMDEIFKALKRNLRDASKKQQNLDDIAKFQDLVVESNRLKPSNLPVDAQKDFTQKMMELYGQTIAIEWALNSGQDIKVIGEFYNEMITIRDAGHDLYEPKK